MKKISSAVILLTAAILALSYWFHSADSGPGSAPSLSSTTPAGTVAPAPPAAPLSPQTDSFHQWAARYAAASPNERALLLETGKPLAHAHRARLKSLITADPRRALEEALPVLLRQQLPPEITDLIEQRINTRGLYGVLGVTAAAGTTAPPIRRTFQTADGTTYEAHVYGRRVRQRTTQNAAAHGIALDGQLALHEDPLRLMETGERPQPGEPVFLNCPVSGKTVTAAAAEEVTIETPAVELAGEVHFLCTGGHIHALREETLAAEGGTGGPAKPTGTVPFSWSTGAKSVLFIRVTFPEQWTDPQQEKDAYDMMKAVNDFFVENSHGALHLLTTVTPLLTMPRPASWYAANDRSGASAVLADARAAARAAGFDFAAYDLDAVRYSGASGGFSGQAFVGGRGCWLKSSAAGVACHELGHNLGLWHANFWSTGGESAIGSGTNSEYGNAFDTMGSANAGNYSFNAGHQNEINWIPDENVTRITSSGLYRLYQFDQPRIDPAARYLLTIAKDAQRDYWCEFRQKWTSNAWLMNGVQVNWSPWGDSATDDTAYGSNAGGQLLDTTPGSLDGKSDSPIILGRTFTDPGAQIHITPLSRGGTVPESVDVAVNIGPFPGNQAPLLEFPAGEIIAETGVEKEIVTFSVDPEGDPLAWSWDWGDRTFGPNAPAATKTWSTAGLYTLRCEVSDMRGGTRSIIRPVTVGTTSQHRIGGRVLTAAGTPVAGARVSCVQTGTTSTGLHLCLTDSGGNFLLSGITDADYTLNATHESFTLTPAFANPVTVAGNNPAANYTATAKPAVTISLPDDVCTEDGDGALLRFTRTAATNAGALSVRVFVGGSASMSDVDFNPVATYNLSTWQFTLPDGAATLNVAISAVNDTFAEGPETLTFYLVDGSGYIPAGVEHVTLLVQDDDTTLPVVSLTALDDNASEAGDPATLRLTRTGPFTAPLVVSLTRSGTAATPADYTGINTTATIPAGAASVDLSLSATEDNDAEGTETAVFSISSSASWIRSPVATSAIIQILDADIPVVTVTAPDASASEANSDPAVFLFTRTGDLSSALTVDYALGGTAQHGTDYWPLSGTVTIPSGQPNAALVITPVDDAIGEQAQTVIASVRSTTRYTTGAAFSATATIADNDLPHIMVSVSDGNCDESGGTGRFKIQSYGTGSTGTTVFYTLSGTAVSGVDFSPVTGSISVPRSGFSEVTISPLQDSDFEDSESVILTLLPDAAYTIAPEKTAVLTISDDDQPGVSVSAAAATYSENSPSARFYFSRSGPTADALVVSYSFGGTASAGEDYTIPPGTITIPAGASGVNLDITLLDDTTPEGSESLICSVINTPGTYGARVPSATIWLADNETAGLPSVGFATGLSTVNEDAGLRQIEVILSPPAAVTVRVDYALDAGLAFNGADYLASSGTLTFPPGTTSRSIPVTILDDPFKEPSETLTLRLLRASAARLNAASHVITINDNDALPPPVAGFAAPSSTAGEGSGTPPGAVVFLSSPQAAPLTVSWAVTGGTATASDASTLGGTLTFQPGETAKPVPLQITDDTQQEPSETFILTLSAPAPPLSLAPQISHTLTISDNDAAIVNLTVTSPVAAEQNSVPGVFTVTRSSSGLDQPLTVPLTVSGTAAATEDYAALPAEIIIPADETSVSLSVTPVDDAVLDPAETVTLTLTPSAFYTTGPQTSGTVTITDNETGITVSAPDALAGEPADTARFTLTRSGPSSGTLTVSLATGGTATPGTDFSPLPASVVFANGQTTLNLTITPLDDTLPEPVETITLTVLPGPRYLVSGAPAQITLSDDDANLAPVVRLLSPTTPSVFLPSGPGLVLRAAVTDDARPLPATPPALNWSVLSGPGSVFFGDLAATDTTAQFSTPGQYLLRLTASDAELSGSADLSVFVLGNTFTGTNIGHSSTVTGFAGGGSTWTLAGLGTTVGTATADSTYFTHRPMSGDFTIIARVVSISTPGDSSRCGVMVRSALTPGARHAFASVAPTRSSFVYRTSDNAAGVTSNTTLTNATPRYVRLRRSGNTFTAAHSTDGTTWTTQGSSATIVMPDPVFVGLCATSASTTTAVTAAFDNFSLTPAAGTAPCVNAGPPLVSGFHATLNGTVTSDNSPSIYWEKRSGPGSVVLPDTPAGDAVFAASGTYVLRLFADDRNAQTFADTSVQVTSPFLEWQALHFGPTSTNPLIAGPRADPDADGFENLVEYALLSNPLKAGTSTVPVSSLHGSTLTLTWRESADAADASIEPQWSDSLTNWTAEGFDVETTASGPGWKEQRATLDISLRRRAAVRLLITLP